MRVVVRPPDCRDADGAQDVQAELPLVVAEVARQELRAGLARVDVGLWDAGQVTDVVHGCHPQRLPAVPPRPSGTDLVVEDDVLLLTIRGAARCEAAPTEVVGRGEPGLARSDDEHVDGRRGGHDLSVSGRDA